VGELQLFDIQSSTLQISVPDNSVLLDQPFPSTISFVQIHPQVICCHRRVGEEMINPGNTPRSGDPLKFPF
jgi:hypothetical protein